MTGLSVLYSKKLDYPSHPAIQSREVPGRLREVYWAHRARSTGSRNSFSHIECGMQNLSSVIGRTSSDPGDEFYHVVKVSPRVEHKFEWVEVVEVYSTVPAIQINEAMRYLNGIPNKNPFILDTFLASIPLGRPTPSEQQQAADLVVQEIEKKLCKSSYTELLSKYGYGILVVGMPLWFATPPLTPYRAKNVIDDFFTRLAFGLMDIKRRILKRRNCSFKKIVVTWDTSPQAMSEWYYQRSVEYEEMANASPQHFIAAALEKKLLKFCSSPSKYDIEECEMPSYSYTFDIAVRKEKKRGIGPYPEIVEALCKSIPEQKPVFTARLKFLIIKITCMSTKLICFVKYHKFAGLIRWGGRKFSFLRGCRLIVYRLNARRLYYNSGRRCELS